jgi:hypothetical protein
MEGNYGVYARYYDCYTIPTVTDTIPNILGPRKGGEVMLALVLVLLGAISFGLGRLSAMSGNASTPIQTCAQAPAALPAVMDETGTTRAALTEQSIGGEYVASKNGSVYHFPWCSGAQRIKEENKVWFPSVEEARAAGYRPAANCKGL